MARMTLHLDACVAFHPLTRDRGNEAIVTGIRRHAEWPWNSQLTAIYGRNSPSTMAEDTSLW